MKSTAFERFFEGCTFKIGLSFKNPWTYKHDSCQFASHCSYLGDKFLRRNFNIESGESLKLSTRNKEAKSASSLKSQSRSFVNSIKAFQEVDACVFDAFDVDRTGFEYDRKGEDLFCPQKDGDDIENSEAILFEAIEFPWVFYGPSAKSFISYLECKGRDGQTRLFSNPIIQHIILFQWRYFKQSYIKYRFIPYILFFAIVVFYITVTHEFEKSDDPDIYGKTHPWTD